MGTKSWQDTVMPLEYSAIDGLNCAGVSDERILRALKAQAETSFRAGIKEVVEWINTHSQGLFDGRMERHYEQVGLTLELKEWQAKLKEWGIDGN